MVAEQVDDSTALDATERFLSNLESRQFSQLQELFATNAAYWVSGNPTRVPWAGEALISDRIQQLETMHGGFRTFTVNRRSLLAYDRKAVVEFDLDAEDRVGGRYLNTIVMIFDFDERYKIRSLREYLDNMQTIEYLDGKELFN